MMAKIGRLARNFLVIGGLAVICILISGCTAAGQHISLTDYEAGQEYRADVVGEIQAGQPLDQTFVSRHPRLDGLELWLQPPAATPPEAALTIEILRPDGVEEPETLVSQTVTYAALAGQFPLAVTFPPLDASAGRAFTLRLSSNGEPLKALGRAEDVYPDGEMSIAGQPAGADLAFGLTYAYDAVALLDDLRLALRYAWLVFPALLALWLPGRVLLLAWEDKITAASLDWGERSALSVGLSLAIFPVLMLWTTSLGLSWNRTALWLFLSGLAMVYAWRMLARRRAPAPTPRPSLAARLRSPQTAAGLALALILLVSLGVRLVMVRDLATPAWVDSVHHAILTRLILDQGAIPAGYAPLVEGVTISYHPGFHISLAVFTWLSGLPLHSAMLFYGQLLNALAALSVYLFTTTYFRSRLAALLAALLVGLVSPMPAYYVSWGRYTQLAGLLILPACAALLVNLRQEMMQSSGQAWLKAIFARQRTLFLLATLTLGGLYLTHYRVAGFIVILIACDVLVENLRAVFRRPAPAGSPRQSILPGMAACLLAGAAGLALTAPWWPAALQELILPRAGPAAAASPLFKDFSWHYLTAAAGQQMLWLAGGGLLLALLLNGRAALKMALWVGLLFTIANLSSYALPGGGWINNTSVEIALYIPLSALGGYGLARLIAIPRRWLKGRLLILYVLPWIAVCAVAGLAAAQRLLPLINPVTVLSRQADLPAMAWIEQNIPPGETILINPFRWGYGLYAGSDGGYWITPLAGRPTLPPTVLVGMSSDWEPARLARLHTRQVMEAAGDPTALHDLMQSLDIEYIYIGARGGLFSAQALQNSGLFEVIYQYRSTWTLQRR